MDYQYATLEITTRAGCPVACTYCPQDKTAKVHKGERLMTVETLGKCLDKVPVIINNLGNQSPRIEFSGFSEPYSNPQCSDLINLVYDKGFRNMTLYTTFRGAKMIDFDRIKHIPFIFVSIHLPDAEGMAKIPLHEDYFPLLDKFMDTFNVGFFAYGAIKPEVSDFIIKKHADAFSGRYNWQTIIHSRAGNVEGVEPVKRMAGHIKCGAIHNMEMNHNILLPNGDVALCCMDFGLKHIIGNLLRDEYYDLFRSDEHNKVVAGMYVDEMDLMCRICNYAEPNHKN